MKIKFKCIICTIIVGILATSSFAAEVKTQDINITNYKFDMCDHNIREILIGTNANNICSIKDGDMDNEQKHLQDDQDTRGKVYVCKPFVLDHFGVIKDSLKKFGVSGEKLASYIKDGKKLEEVLKLEDIPVKSFKKEVIKQYNIRVREGVKEGGLTKEQAKKLRQAIKQTIKKWLN